MKTQLVTIPTRLGSISVAIDVPSLVSTLLPTLGTVSHASKFRETQGRLVALDDMSEPAIHYLPLPSPSPDSHPLTLNLYLILSPSSSTSTPISKYHISSITRQFHSIAR